MSGPSCGRADGAPIPSPADLGLAGRVPVVVLTGFLGSGKTTLLARFLRHAEARDTVVIVNELGEVGLDHLLVQSPADETVLLDNGCLCCALLGDLALTLGRLIARRAAGEIAPFRRVVIETTGTADPVPLLQTLIEDPQVRPFFRLDGVITVVDGRNGEGQLDAHFQCVKQIAVADRVLLSKVDLIGPGEQAALEARIRVLNPGATVETVVHGAIEPARIIGAALDPRGPRAGSVEAWLSEEAAAVAERARAGGCPAGGAHDHDGPAPHDHGDGVHTFSVRRDGPVHPAGLKLWLDLLSVFLGPGLLRVKGIVNVDGSPVVVNAVQHVCHPPESLDAWPGPARDSRIVFITRGLERAALESTLDALAFRPAGDGPRGRIDPADYARFTGILGHFRGPGATPGG